MSPYIDRDDWCLHHNETSNTIRIVKLKNNRKLSWPAHFQEVGDMVLNKITYDRNVAHFLSTALEEITMSPALKNVYSKSSTFQLFTIRQNKIHV